MTSAAELGSVLAKVAPSGQAWPRPTTSVFRAVLEGLAAGPSEVERRADQLQVEIDPRSALELLPDFERLLGLPSACTAGEPQTVVERRAAVVQKLTAVRGATVDELELLAASLGIVSEVVEYRAFVAGSHAGDLLSNGGWLYTVTLRAPVATGAFFRAGTSGAGDSLFSLSGPSLECLVADWVPAHVVGLVEYTLEADPSWQPWQPATLRPAAFSAAPTVVSPNLQG
jgi:uncharacterized protein YmfQ (DUF2313 family)